MAKDSSVLAKCWILRVLSSLKKKKNSLHVCDKKVQEIIQMFSNTFLVYMHCSLPSSQMWLCISLWRKKSLLKILDTRVLQTCCYKSTAFILRLKKWFLWLQAEEYLDHLSLDSWVLVFISRMCGNPSEVFSIAPAFPCWLPKELSPNIATKVRFLNWQYQLITQMSPNEHAVQIIHIIIIWIRAHNTRRTIKLVSQIPSYFVLESLLKC